MLVSGLARGYRRYPARLSAPVALTLTLSRCRWVFGGEGITPCPAPLDPGLRRDDGVFSLDPGFRRDDGGFRLSPGFRGDDGVFLRKRIDDE